MLVEQSQKKEGPTDDACEERRLNVHGLLHQRTVKAFGLGTERLSNRDHQPGTSIWHMGHGVSCLVVRVPAILAKVLARIVSTHPASTTAMEPRLHSRPFSKSKSPPHQAYCFNYFSFGTEGFLLKIRVVFIVICLQFPPMFYTVFCNFLFLLIFFFRLEMHDGAICPWLSVLILSVRSIPKTKIILLNLLLILLRALLRLACTTCPAVLRAASIRMNCISALSLC